MTKSRQKFDAAFSIAVCFPRCDFIDERLFVWDPPVEAPGCEDAELWTAVASILRLHVG